MPSTIINAATRRPPSIVLVLTALATTGGKVLVAVGTEALLAELNVAVGTRQEVAEPVCAGELQYSVADAGTLSIWFEAIAVPVLGNTQVQVTPSAHIVGPSLPVH